MTNRTAAFSGAILSVAILAGGCIPVTPNQAKGRVGNTPSGNLKLPSPPPPKKLVPIDAELRQAAETEISKEFGSNDPFLRANAVEATQKTTGAADAPRIISALTDSSPAVRFAGAMAAGSLRLEQARPRLLTMTEDADASVQVAVRFALHRLGDTRLSHDLETFAKNPNPRVRANVALALGLLEEKSALNILNVLQRDDDVIVRLQTIEAGWRLGDEDSRNKLITGTISKYPDDQIVSLLALAGPKRKEIMRYVRSQLTNDYDEVKLAAARGVGMLGEDDGMGIALKAVKSDNPRQRAMAAMALGAIGRSDGQSALKTLLRDSDPNVRLAAATAILQLKPN
jgi:HEAT repeat protein